MSDFLKCLVTTLSVHYISVLEFKEATRDRVGCVELRFAELGAISVGLEIEVDRGTPLSDSKCKSRFPHLSRASATAG